MRKGGGWAMPRGQVSIPVRALLCWRQRLLVVARLTLATSHTAARSSVLSACWRAHSSPRHACGLHRVLFLRACGDLKGPPVQCVVAIPQHQWSLRNPAREPVVDGLPSGLTANGIAREILR